MQSVKKDKKVRSKKDKKLIKLINNSDSEQEETEHELSFYTKDRIKLMKEVLKIIKPKKIKCMAPDFLKNYDSEEINSMLLEELLGISNKRLKYILNGQNLDEDSSSSADSENEQPPIDIISLDDITDDDFIIDLDSDNGTRGKQVKKKGKVKVKEEPKKKKIKKEKKDKQPKGSKKGTEKDKTGEENLMSVLELLELQARARAIRSQLILESKRKEEMEKEANEKKEKEDSDNDDAVIIESPKNIEIVITSSESDMDETKQEKNTAASLENSSQNEQNNKNEANVEPQENPERSETINDNAEQKSLENENSNERVESEISTDKTVEVSKTVEVGKTFNKTVEKLSNKTSNSPKSINQSQSQEQSEKKKTDFTNNADDGDGIIINIDTSDIECIISD